MGEKKQDRKGNNSHSAGSICIIGIGPGSLEHLTLKAKEALESCDVVVGYKTYIDLIKNLISGKEIFSTGMTKEVDRCQKAIELALQGKKVAVVSSGDAGIYGMAGLVFELLQGSANPAFLLPHPRSQIPVSVVPGVPAFCAAASLLGAPLMHDFASISLSDLLTPWEIIKKRLKMASEGDFVIILYNPRSKTRVSQIEGAIEIISMHRDGNTPVGIVKNALRDGEEIKITTLKEMPSHYDFIDMSTILIVGNSATFISNNRMITPRGYDV